MSMSYSRILVIYLCNQLAKYQSAYIDLSEIQIQFLASTFILYSYNMISEHRIFSKECQTMRIAFYNREISLHSNNVRHICGIISK